MTYKCYVDSIKKQLFAELNFTESHTHRHTHTDTNTDTHTHTHISKCKVNTSIPLKQLTRILCISPWLFSLGLFPPEAHTSTSTASCRLLERFQFWDFHFLSVSAWQPFFSCHWVNELNFPQYMSKWKCVCCVASNIHVTKIFCSVICLNDPFSSRIKTYSMHLCVWVSECVCVCVCVSVCLCVCVFL